MIKPGFMHFRCSSETLQSFLRTIIIGAQRLGSLYISVFYKALTFLVGVTLSLSPTM